MSRAQQIGHLLQHHTIDPSCAVFSLGRPVGEQRSGGPFEIKAPRAQLAIGGHAEILVTEIAPAGNRHRIVGNE